MTEGDLAARLAATSFRYPLRRYQQAAVDAFEQARREGRARFYAVLPPGGGKTAVGLEVARRLGRRTLVLCPNTAVQAQWLRQWQDFTPHTVAAGADPDLTTPITVLTYQALCVLNGDDTLDEEALDLWIATLQAEKGYSAEQARAEIQALEASGSPHYRADLARFRRRARTLVARAGIAATSSRCCTPTAGRSSRAWRPAAPGPSSWTNATTCWRCGVTSSAPWSRSWATSSSSA